MCGRESGPEVILQALRDETLYDPRERIEVTRNVSIYKPSLLGTAKLGSKMFPTLINEHKKLDSFLGVDIKFKILISFQEASVT